MEIKSAKKLKKQEKTEKVHAHVCIVVKNLEEIKKRWSRYLGIPITNINIMEGPSVIRGEDRGRCKVLIGFADVGNLRIEFIQPVEGETQEIEFLEAHGDGVHHIDPGFPLLKTMDERIAEWEKKEIKVLQVDEENRWAYMDTEKLLGAIIELH